jgi:hypothetical protein
MINTLLKSAFLALTLTMAASTLAHADCEADLLKLEDALAKPDLTADNKTTLEAAGEKASTALRKDDDDVCHQIVTDALAATGTAPAASTAPASTASLGDLSSFKIISADTLKSVEGGDLAAAKTRIADLETAWDVSADKLKAVNTDSWDKLDKLIDKSLKALRTGTPDAKTSGDALTALNTAFDEMQGM